MITKEYLLNHNCFIQNEYFEKYLDLIVSNQLTSVEKFRTQSHHIIPIAYFVKNGIDIDNSQQNRVTLLYKDHILAHYYLALSGTDEYKASFAEAFMFLVKRISIISDSTKPSSYIKDNIEIAQLKEELPMYQFLYEYVKKSQHLLNKGGKWMNNGKTQRYVRPSDMEKLFNEGFIVGKLPVTDRTKELMRKNKTNIGRKVVNNGSANKFVAADKVSEYLATGWKLGRYDKETFRNRVMSEETRAKISAGKQGSTPWNKGKTKFTDERILKYSTSQGGIDSQFKSGHTPWNKVKEFTPETIEKMKYAAKHRKHITEE